MMKKTMCFSDDFSFPSLVTSSKNAALPIRHPKKMTISRPPTGSIMLEVRKSRKSLNANPSMVNGVFFIRLNEAKTPITIVATQAISVDFLRLRCSSSER